MYSNRSELIFNLRIFLAIVLALLITGFVFIYSASSVFALEKFGFASYFVKKQIFGALLGIVFVLITIKLPLNFIKKLSPLFFYGSLFLTALTLIPGLGQKIHGSSRWLSLAGFSFQPSELLKVSLILYVAYLLEKKIYQRASFAHSYLPLVFILVITCGILLKQPDFGLSVALAFTTFILLFIAQFKAIYLVSTILLSLPVLISLVLFKSYRLKRILTFLDPWQDSQGAGFQIIQSLIAIGSGGFWGIGISNSKQKFFYLPMQHTDFIFSIIAEETGFVGSACLIMLFVGFLYFGIRIAFKFNDTFCVFSTLGFVVLISAQALINFCVAAGLFPTKGIGLPFVSYGNSALICSLLMVGLIINYVKNNSY
ncbi:MAG: putative lipid II flippase FtsW [Candidatus Babeliales bacterium]|nr:putative lipid II flippase FtsW [Candidatus Babeliales bacterium]